MNSPRALSGVFVSSSTSIPEPRHFKHSRKAPSSCYPGRREEITRSVCSPTGTSFSRRRSPGRGPSPQPPQALRRSMAGLARGGQCPTSPASPTCIPRPRGCRKPSQSVEVVDCCKPSAEAAKTFDAVDGALRAVQTAIGQRSPPKSVAEDDADCRRYREYMMKSKLTAGDRRPSLCSNEDLESLCGTECTESTACSSSFSEDRAAAGRRLSKNANIARLEDARRTLKERIGAEERSVRFTRNFLAKLEEFRDVVGEDGCDTA